MQQLNPWVGWLHPGGRWRLRRVLLGLLGGGLLGCVAALPEPTAAHLALAQAEEPAVSMMDLQRGRSLYTQRCASCHALRPPGERAPDAWPDEVARMQREHGVRLSDDEKLDIVRYLRVSSAVPAT